MSKTHGGFDCQRWDSQVPHSHKFNKEAFPDAGLSENFCRNPDGEVDGPWCYTESSDKRWEYCDVPPCFYGKFIFEVIIQKLACILQNLSSKRLFIEKRLSSRLGSSRVSALRNSE